MMKKIISLIVALVMCLSLCACGGVNKPDNQPEENNSKGDVESDTSNAHGDFYTLSGMSPMEVALYMYDREWTVEDGDSLGLPTKLKFQTDGTCVATYPDRQENLYWGYAPGGDTSLYALYVRVGTQDDILYLFHVRGTNDLNHSGPIAWHSFVSAGGNPIDGLSEDGYEGMWFAAGSFLEDSETDDSEKDEQTGDNYEKIELTVENWDTYFELTEEHVFIKNAFGENYSLEFYQFYRLKEGYEVVESETSIAIEYSYDWGDRRCDIDYEAETYTLGEYVNGPQTYTAMQSYFANWNDGRYAVKVNQNSGGCFTHEETVRVDSNFKIIRVQGTLCLKKN